MNEIFERIPIFKEIKFKFDLEKLDEESIKISFEHKEIFERSGNFLFGGFIAMIFDAFLGFLIRNSTKKRFGNNKLNNRVLE